MAAFDILDKYEATTKSKKEIAEPSAQAQEDQLKLHSIRIKESIYKRFQQYVRKETDSKLQDVIEQMFLEFLEAHENK